MNFERRTLNVEVGRGRGLEGEEFAEGFADGFWGWAVGGPEFWVVGDGGVACVEAEGGGVEEVESFFGDA